MLHFVGLGKKMIHNQWESIWILTNLELINSDFHSFTSFISFLFLCTNTYFREHLAPCPPLERWYHWALPPSARQEVQLRENDLPQVCFTFYPPLPLHFSSISTNSTFPLKMHFIILELLLIFFPWLRSHNSHCALTSPPRYPPPSPHLLIFFLGAMLDCTPAQRTAGRRSAVTPATCAPRRS